MKIAFAGKGGSGKTTLSSLFVRYLAARGLPVVAIDADINQHLAEALGAERAAGRWARTCRRSRSTCAAPTRGSARPRPWSRRPRPAAAPGCCGPAAPTRSTTLGVDRPVRGAAAGHRPLRARTTWAWRATTPRPARSSCTSTTSSTGRASTWWWTARPGADSFASGLFTRFDLTFLVAEPTRKGVSVYRQWQDYAAGFDVAVALVGNKVQRPRGRGVPARARRRGPAGLVRPRARGPGHGAGPPVRPGRPQPRIPRPRSPPSRHRLDAAATGTGPGTPARRRSSTAGTPGPGPATAQARTWRRQIDPEFTLGPHALTLTMT